MALSNITSTPSPPPLLPSYPLSWAVGGGVQLDSQVPGMQVMVEEQSSMIRTRGPPGSTGGTVTREIYSAYRDKTGTLDRQVC